MPPHTERHASPEDVAAAVAALPRDALLRLKRRAELQVGGTEYTNPLELLGEAVTRAMVATDPNKREDERGRPWPIDRVELPAFLSMSIDSIADTSRKSLQPLDSTNRAASAPMRVRFMSVRVMVRTPP